MPCSGLMPITSSTPMRWAHRNCIEPASCWRPSRRPRTEACTRVDLRRRLPNREADHLFKEESRGPAAHPACAKPLDWIGPVTEVLSLEARDSRYRSSRVFAFYTSTYGNPRRFGEANSQPNMVRWRLVIPLFCFQSTFTRNGFSKLIVMTCEDTAGL